MRRQLFLLFSILGTSLLALVAPHLAHAATATFTQVVPSSGVCNCQYAPDFGCLLQLMQNLIDDAVVLGTILITLFIARAGFQFIANPTNEEARSKARASVTNAVIGLLIVLGAWLLIDSVMKVIYNSSASGTGVAQLGPWNQILSSTGGGNCIQKRDNPGILTAAGQLTNPGATAAGGAAVPGAPISPGGVGACSASTMQAAAAAEGVQIPASTANVLACVAGPESNCGAVNQNYSWNKANSSGKASTAYGPYQVTLSGNSSCYDNVACEQAVGASGPLNCKAGFDKNGFPLNNSTTNTCTQAASNLGCNAAAAACVYNKQGIGAWTADANSTTQGSCQS